MFYPECVVSVLKYVVLKQMNFDWWLEVVFDITLHAIILEIMTQD